MDKYIGIQNPELCKNCFKCVQSCFPKAIKIEKNNVIRDDERCINCGYCTKACNMNIHFVYKHYEEIESLLKSNKKVIIILDSIYQSEFKNITFNQMKKALKLLGFYDVVETATSYSLYKYMVKKYFDKSNKTVIEGFCIPFIEYIKKFYPDLTANIAPFQSPEDICSRLVKENYKNEEIYTVYMSSCFSSLSKNNKYGFDYFMLVSELKSMFKNAQIDLHNIEDSKEIRDVYKYSIRDNTEIIDSPEECHEFLEYLSKGGKCNKVIEPYWCKNQCFGTPVFDNKLSSFERKLLYINYRKQYCNIIKLNDENVKIFGDLNRFHYKHSATPIKEEKFSEEEITQMLNSIGKSEKSNEFDCGACGYNTCRENAIAMLKGMSSIGHCVPYISKKFEENADRVLRAYQELDDAFALIIPNSRLVYKLKHTKEYQDKYIKENGKIEIVDVIKDGGYRHVVNALKVAADLHTKGVMSIIGLEKDTLVKTIIFHDIGKSQPSLEVGDQVDPKAVFENGKMHAFRSAELALANYKSEGINEDIYNLIRYHHHPEEELPEEFPEHLLPMYRLFRIIDGMSAGLTRRGSTVKFELVGSVLFIKEDSQHPKYKQFYSIDLYKPEYEKKEYDYKDTIDIILKTPKYKQK